MAIAVVAIVAGLIVGVAIELLLASRHRARSGTTYEIDTETLLPPQRGRPGQSEIRFIETGEGFRILEPDECGDPGAIAPEGDDLPGPPAVD
ncbi:unannotated protein [freshwater metagenome]|uniref:Unannotated protein n=1 Tax=freshwater metagenome TaxID=449393 RepID=A0A6J6G5C8_9ZZZZ